MTEKECMERVRDLRIARSGTVSLINDRGSLFYKDVTLQMFCKSYECEIERLEGLLHRSELLDSEDVLGLLL